MEAKGFSVLYIPVERLAMNRSRRVRNLETASAGGRKQELLFVIGIEGLDMEGLAEGFFSRDRKRVEVFPSRQLQSAGSFSQPISGLEGSATAAACSAEDLRV